MQIGEKKTNSNIFKFIRLIHLLEYATATTFHAMHTCY